MEFRNWFIGCDFAGCYIKPMRQYLQTISLSHSPQSASSSTPMSHSKLDSNSDPPHCNNASSLPNSHHFNPLSSLTQLIFNYTIHCAFGVLPLPASHQQPPLISCPYILRMRWTDHLRHFAFQFPLI